MTTRPAKIVGIVFCETRGKRSYISRKEARRVARTIPPDGGPRLNPYRCDVMEGYWHLGHLPARVRRGNAGREDIWPNRTVTG